MPLADLDAAFVRSVAIPPKGKVDYYSNEITGFILEVRSTGGKTYYVRYRDSHGKQRQVKIGDAKSVSFDKARQAAERLRSRVVLGDSPIEDKKTLRSVPTLATFADTYIEHVKRTRRNYESSLGFLRMHVLPRFGSLHLDQITTAAIADAHQELLDKGYALATSNKLPVILKIIFNLAKRLKVPGAEANPAAEFKIVQPQNGRERFLTQEETARLKDALEQSKHPQLKNAVALMLMLGFRKRELLDAKWGDVDLERRSWLIPLSKSGKPRRVIISGAALDVLAKLPRWENCPYVVPDPATLKPYITLQYHWDIARKKAGLLDVRMHDLRHSFASNLVNSGRSILEVSKLLGHSSVSMSQRYTHLADETLFSAVDAAANAMGTSWTDPQKVAA